MSQVSVLMLDIKDSTPLSQRLGGEAYRNTFLPEFDRIVTGKIAAHQGREFQRQEHRGDDCVKAVFDTPFLAVACAVDLQNYFKQFCIPVAGDDVPVVFRSAVHTCPAMDDKTPDTAEMPIAARVLALSGGGQILLSQAAYDAYSQKANPMPFACRKFGPYDLKGVAGVQNVYDVPYDGAHRDEPGTGLIDYAAVEAANQYIARVELEQTIRDTFAQTVGRSGQCRFVTIYGEGGMGKTRLAVNCAKQMAGDFPGGIAWVPLAFIENPTADNVADAIYRALRLEPKPGDTQAHLLAHLKTRPQTLLLLDNAETVAGREAVTVLLHDLLSAVPQLHFLTTSRRQIGLNTQEEVIDVNGGLSVGEAYRLFQVRADKSFALPSADDAEIARFRAILVAADYQLPTTEPFTATEQSLLWLLLLFQRANHNTLALELIASWTRKYQTPRGLLENYEEAFGMLTEIADGLPAGDVKARERHRSLEASYHWSWKNLGEEKNGFDAQSAFLAAALFATTFTDESVNAVLGWEDLKRTAKALMTVQNAALIRAVTSRYAMHWQLREYANRRKFSTNTPDALPDITTLQERLVAFYDARMEQYETNDNLIQTAEARAWLDEEWRNVVTAARVADTFAPSKPAVGLRLRLSPYFGLTSAWQAWEGIALEAKQAAVKIDQHTGDKRGEAATLGNLGNVYQAQSRWQEAEDVYQASLVIKRAIGDKHGEGQTLVNLTILRLQQGKREQGAEYARQGIAAAKQTEDTALVKQLDDLLISCTASPGNVVSRFFARFRRRG